MSIPNDEQVTADGISSSNEITHQKQIIDVSSNLSSLNLSSLNRSIEGKTATGFHERITCRGPHGGSMGEPFNDENMARHGNITRIAVRHGEFIHGIRLMYGKKWGPFHGDEVEGNYTENSITGNISQVVGRSAEYVDQLTFITEEGNMYGPFGGPGGRPFNVKFKDPVSLKYVSGQANDFLDNISFHF